MKGNAPTMKDVAREAGVALGTVSKVFNGLPVGESYRKRVLRAAEELGYQVNNYARGLRSNQTHVVALILPGVEHPFFAGLCEHVSHALSKRGYRMLLSLTGYDYTAEQTCIQMVQQNKVDGIIGLTYSPTLQVSDSIPFVSIDRYLNNRIPCITSDNYEGGQMAARKLAELGCQRLLFLRIGSVVGGEPDKRGIGFEAYCREHGLSFETLRCNDEEGYEPIERFLAQHMQGESLDFDGIFCATDQLALVVRQMLEEHGVSVPRQVQIIGFDGLRPFRNMGFYCSTIAQSIDQLAETAVDLLLREKHRQVTGVICLPVTYYPGGTTRDTLE